MKKGGRVKTAVGIVFCVIFFLYGCQSSEELTLEKRKELLEELRGTVISNEEVIRSVVPEYFRSQPSAFRASYEFYAYDWEKDPVGRFLEQVEAGEKSFKKPEIDVAIDAYSRPMDTSFISDIDENLTLAYEEEGEDYRKYSYEYGEDSYIVIHRTLGENDHYQLPDRRTFTKWGTPVEVWVIGNIQHYQFEKIGIHYHVKMQGEIPRTVIEPLLYRLINYW